MKGCFVDLRELHRRTAIPRRKLRYALDHRLVPDEGITIDPGVAGCPRRFSERVGMAIVCAVRLQDLAMPHALIRQCTASLHRLSAGDDSVLQTVVQSGELTFVVTVDIGRIREQIYATK